MQEQVYWSRLKEIGKKVEKVLFDPINFFKGYKVEGFGDMLTYYCILAIIPALLGSLSLLSQVRVLKVLFEAEIVPVLSPITYLALALMTYILSILGILIASAVYHVLIWIAGGRKGIINTFAAVIYSSTPSLVLGWIPVVRIIIYLWSLVLTIIGLAKLHKVSYWRSAFAVILLPLIIFFALFSLIFLPLIF